MSSLSHIWRMFEPVLTPYDFGEVAEWEDLPCADEWITSSTTPAGPDGERVLTYEHMVSLREAIAGCTDLDDWQRREARITLARLDLEIRSYQDGKYTYYRG